MIGSCAGKNCPVADMVKSVEDAYINYAECKRIQRGRHSTCIFEVSAAVLFLLTLASVTSVLSGF